MRSIQGSLKKSTVISNGQTNLEQSSSYLQEIYCIPMMGSKFINFIHQDDYLYDNVKFSSFTVLDDVMILMGGQSKQKIFIFDPYGKPLVLNIDQKDVSIIEDGKILNITTSTDKQFFLIELKNEFFIGQLTYDTKCSIGL